eukprot:TRINITY_DN20245_c0_g1_i1.p1 TRINITY_DN20245_c0_g1~~TRINITY_DN20245_c0_g1_i1.p1  ORF type:complete len:385 (+),score=62.81 TRINITY_DN20245_c0_g1_i1:61-1215(+)
MPSPDATQPGMAGVLFQMRQHVESQCDFLEKQLALQREHLQEQLRHIDEQLALVFGNQDPEVEVFEISTEVEGHQAGSAAIKIVDASNPKFAKDDQAAIGINPLPKTAEEVEPKGEKPPDMKKAKAELDDWVKYSGLHTVDTWLENYNKHPAGWGGLLMIHGIPEVSARLRLKVQNFAIFAALFLGGSIKALSGKPPFSTENTIRLRIFTYSFCIGIATHILCIMLGMTFHNALSECARDADVFRMFARGKGFRATAWCEMSFYIGAVACCVGIVSVQYDFVGWEVLPVCVLLAIIVWCTGRHTHNLLFNSGSIVKYWRPEKGGKPDLGDPYDLSVPVANLRVKAEYELAHAAGDVLGPQRPGTRTSVSVTNSSAVATIIGGAE